MIFTQITMQVYNKQEVSGSQRLHVNNDKVFKLIFVPSKTIEAGLLTYIRMYV